MISPELVRVLLQVFVRQVNVGTPRHSIHTMYTLWIGVFISIKVNMYWNKVVSVNQHKGFRNSTFKQSTLQISSHYHSLVRNWFTHASCIYCSCSILDIKFDFQSLEMSYLLHAFESYFRPRVSFCLSLKDMKSSKTERDNARIIFYSVSLSITLLYVKLI